MFEAIVNFILNGSGYVWLDAIINLVAGSTAITMLTPTKVDDKIFGGIGKGLNLALKVLNIASGNVGANKNHDDK